MSQTNTALFNLLSNKYFLLLFAVGLIIFAAFGLPILATMPHVLISAGLILIGLTIMFRTMVTPITITIGLIFIAVAVLVYLFPGWFGIELPGVV